MSDSRSLTAIEARKLVEEIASSHGWFSKHLREKTPEEVLRAVDLLRTGYGAAVRTLAEGLYRSQARFVFELIQNAEDNSYTRASASGAKPNIDFRIYPDRIEVDSNEDGFTAENVRAICAVARSTKVRTGAQYYIGEKGIGFKSVFMVASKVHIQSGPFSFFFEHVEGDSGIGMIAPEYEDPRPALLDPGTMMTLELIKGLDQSSLHQQFRSLPDTFLLFLNKLERITITIDGFAGSPKELTIHTCYYDTESEHRILENVYFHGPTERRVVKRFFIQRKQLRSLPNDRQRDYNTAEVVLAFPVDDRSVPIIERQTSTRICPLETLDSLRQDIMETTRNYELLIGIAKTFVEAIIRFCEHPTLQYQWMRYLPGVISEPFWSNISTGMRSLIDRTPILRPRSKGPLRMIKDLRIIPEFFKDRVGDPLLPDLSSEIYLAADYSSVDIALLKHWGLRELSMEDILARCEHDLLKGQNSWFKSKEDDDDWHSRVAASLLTMLDTEAALRSVVYRRMRTLKLIPLKSGRFTSILDGPVYFPHTGRTIIPEDLAMRIVSDRAITIPLRKQLFIKLGVENASSADVRRLIKARYSPLGLATSISLDHSIAHLRYLYETHSSEDQRISQLYSTHNSRTKKVFLRETRDHSLPVFESHPPLKIGEWLGISPGTASTFMPLISQEKSAHSADTVCYQSLPFHKPLRGYSFEELRLTDYAAGRGYKRSTRMYPPNGSFGRKAYQYDWLWLYNQEQRLVPPHPRLYLQSNDPLGVQELTKPLFNEESQAAPGLHVSFIHPRYTEAISGEGAEERSAWCAWLEKFLGISPIPCLLDPLFNGPHLSEIILYLVKHRPIQLLPMLKAHWNIYSPQMTPETVFLLGELEMPSNVGMKKLRSTFLPTKSLRQRCAQYISCNAFPFLLLDDMIDAEALDFLEILGVGTKNDLLFYLALLENCILSNAIDKIYQLYEAIELEYHVCQDHGMNSTEFIKHFDRVPSIFAPANINHPAVWYTTSECLWDAPSHMMTKLPLRSVLGNTMSPTLDSFFHGTLNIRDAQWPDLLGELDYQRELSATAVKAEHIRDIYHRLDLILPTVSKSALSSYKKPFIGSKLIYVMPESKWYGIDDCIWSSKHKIKGKANISKQYKRLKKFFIKFLGVQVPDLGMMVQELKKAADSSPKPSVEELKGILWQINDMGPDEEDVEELEGVGELKIFPVRLASGQVELCNEDIPFAISDRKRLEDVFRGRIDFLDFSLEEVHKLQPLIAALDLEDRYLSSAVIERSSVESESRHCSITLTQHLRRRAHALFRCAVHFKCPRAEDNDNQLWKLLLQSEVLETDEITSRLEYPPTRTTITTARSKLHITEDDAGFRFYVPRDTKSREVCYLRLLPSRLFNRCMYRHVEEYSPVADHDAVAVTVISDVLKSSDLVIDDILEEAGVINVPIPEELRYREPPIAGSDGGPETNDTLFSSTLKFHGVLSNRAPSNQTSTANPYLAESTHGSPFSEPLPSPHRSYSPNSRAASHVKDHLHAHADPVEVSPNPKPNEGEYLRLLNSVIKAAKKKRGAFPTKGSFNLQGLFAALPSDPSDISDPYDMPFGVRSENQIQHDIRLGAAGELYAFEIISRLATTLPNFNRENWASTIRKHVAIHPDYSDIPPWKGAETADIVYNDIAGEFTKLLIDNGYLDATVWNGAKPKYYLEVKTTTKAFATRFFLSRSQYDRMQRMKIGNEQAINEIYVILRVFELGEKGMGMRVLLDPEGMRERGELDFRVEGYSVVPSRS